MTYKRTEGDSEISVESYDLEGKSSYRSTSNIARDNISVGNYNNSKVSDPTPPHSPFSPSTTPFTTTSKRLLPKVSNFRI